MCKIMKKYYRKRAQFRKQKRIGMLITILSITCIIVPFISTGLVQEITAGIAPVAFILLIPMGITLIFSKTYYILDDYYYSIKKDSES